MTPVCDLNGKVALVSGAAGVRGIEGRAPRS
jgi:hypothetical protein